MQFTVPKFLERETQIIFGLNLKRLAILGCLSLLLFILKYVLPKVIWYITVFLSLGLFFFFNLVQIGGQNVFELFINAFRFLFTANTYTWDKRESISPLKIVRKPAEEKVRKASPLKFSPESRLSNLRSKIDVGEKPESA
ncbi:hypothetical protein COT20_00265 [bacterium (Candidatus Gribaldobacteria) CG08_land_8_20_14_0_20_39_15]|uniref:PrgI family protein n=1 Tax=bacterium (Candidatus Gribaldobacteria) CG08_land_8_20_14_0_20_39_15 TaxID=2014273 RepID=A0A2M6XVE9_9BACT|nr:MAG: hypothetical protein COT20_00265 [bacterium (Candidatus Gribaldobacteria) CG08_land_8_20_14_0_20_39_15]